MELRDYINDGIKACNGAKQLADYLGILPQAVSNAKAHQRGLPNDACFKLAELLKADVRGVIAASELATEKKEDKRAFWRPFVSGTDYARIAGYALILGLVTNFVTPNPAEAAPLRASSVRTICIMLSRKIFSCIAGFLRSGVVFLQIGAESGPRRFGFAVGQGSTP